ncbi:TetR/AcrR family transcriptional regulator [Shimia haliotis]|uniref:Transcriptional regulator, TetR family n=1 Tax=Shimia haliotis TaxID=1280847 RepID=A0A1I4DUY3_9RHOB|nr:TetR/AcrR family transcriptional regulator [Shimia haliotis]SFK96749.1 transcriptional regulator, TetR family [Shimia haliotis]
MPKIVDHDAYRRSLAERAARLFSEYGYGALGMRKIATHLGVSKSALYHYFPTKEDLFLACTNQVMANFDPDIVDPTASEEENLRCLTDVFQKDFASEMALTFDYLRGKSQAEIANDEAMQLALKAYRDLVESVVGPSRTEEVLAGLFGSLMVAYFSGR